jgi:HEAT repeat protein
MELLRDERLDSEVRAQIPVSLGRLGETAQPALPLLAQMARSRRTDDRIRESCVIAMGLLAPADDKETIELLVKIIDADARNHTSQFAFIALAQIGGRAAADPQLHQETAQSVGRYLLRALTHSDRASHRPWAALALALFGREFAPDSEQRVTAVEKLSRVFEEEDNPSRAAACSIALGLVDARGAGPQLFDRLLDTRDPYLLGYLSVALGMIQHREALDQLRTLVLDDRDSKLRQQAATALGLMGDFEVTPLLVEALRDAKTLHVTASVAKALGLVGDRACIAPLSELVRDERAPGLARAFGCVALGLIAEKFEHHWNTRLSTNANYRAFLQSQIEILDIL